MWGEGSTTADPKAIMRLFVAKSDEGNEKSKVGRSNEGSQGRGGSTGHSRRRRMTVRPKHKVKPEGGNDVGH